MNVHFIAIGGSVMHQLAIALTRKGYQVSGSDDEIFEPAKSNLAQEGILPEAFGWFPEKINNSIDAVILGMHAKEDNPELVRAKELGLKIFSFPEYIYQESRNKTRVAIGGSHGKTTTTAMIMLVLRQTGKNFDYLVGAKLQGFAQSVNITDAPIIICEGDEYPASAIEKKPKFHFLFPHIAVITGIAWDHINVFPTFDFYLQQFNAFIDKIETGGVLIYNEMDDVLKKLVDGHPSNVRKIPYRLPEYHIENGQTIISINGIEKSLQIFGNHNLLNLQAAFFVCKELKIDTGNFLDGIATFAGAAKRLELLANDEKTNVYRDFAHAPSKVKATIEAVKKQFLSRKLIAVLELHTYSSLNDKFMGEYKGTMDEADIAAVFYSKHSLELKRMPELLKEEVMNGFNKKDLIVLNEKKDLENWLSNQSYQNTNLLMMSSGNFDGIDIITFANKIVKQKF